MRSLRIGLFDSGVGGLSVLRVLHELAPGASLHYVADSAHAPYGERDTQAIAERATRIAAHLFDTGAQVLVVACNTATAAAVDALRMRWPDRPVVGVEPGLKPAIAASRNARIGVMATQATLASARFARLLAEHGGDAHVHLQACTGLAAAIEGDADEAALRVQVERHCAPLRAARVDTVALGCTHYVFVQSLIQAALGAEVVLIDTATAVARRAVASCEGHSPASSGPRLLLQSTGPVDALRRVARRWLPFECEVESAPVDL